MNREIKFRAWDVESPCMITWDEIQNQWDIEGYTQSIFKNDHYICMQFTGLKDKNGIEIFEGDVLKLSNGELGEVTYFSNRCFYFISKFRASVLWELFNFYNIEVIGNIFDNPDLIN